MGTKGDPRITRTLLSTVPVEGLTGWETRLYLIEYPPAADGGGHTHPVNAVGWVVNGKITSAFDEDAPETFSAGETFIDPAHRMHTISCNPSDTEPLRFVIAYTVKVGEPVTVWPE